MRKENNVKEREINGYFLGAAELGLPLPPAQAIQSRLGNKISSTENITIVTFSPLLTPMLYTVGVVGRQGSSCWIGETGRCRISTVLRKLEVDKKMKVWTLAESKRRFLGKELAMVERRRRRWAVQRQVKIICRFIFITSFSPN